MYPEMLGEALGVQVNKTTGARVMTADAVTDESTVEVAVTVTVLVAEMGSGAVYKPEGESTPICGEKDHVTAGGVPLAAVTENCWD